MLITELPEMDRPREKLLFKGANSLSDAELLAIFLRTGIKGLSAINLAHRLINQFGGLRQLLQAKQDDFCSIKGLGQAKYAQLQAILELAKRYLEQGLQEKQVFSCPDDTKSYLSHLVSNKEHEVFVCLYLNNQHYLIKSEQLFRGTIDSTSVHPREVVKQALRYNAAAMIIAHNHPSGLAEPSRADESMTKRIKDALSLVDIRLLDHFIIANNQVISLAERGFL